MTPHNNIGYNSKGYEDMATEILKMTDSDPATVVWGPLATEPPRISAWALYRVKVESLVYISAAESMRFFQISAVNSKKRIILQ